VDSPSGQLKPGHQAPLDTGITSRWCCSGRGSNSPKASYYVCDNVCSITALFENLIGVVQEFKQIAVFQQQQYASRHWYALIGRQTTST
jgi:hypothetical protein